MLTPRRSLVCLAFVLLLFAGHALFYNGLVDDAFISFRYARNLAEGQGLVFNPGDRVEGYTNLLWVLLLSGITRIGGDPTIWSRVLGTTAGAGTIVALFLAARRAWPNHPWAILAGPLLLATNRTFCAWGVTGLETALFSLLCLVGVVLAGEDRPARSMLSGLALGLAALTRPEGALVLACLAAVLALQARWRDAGAARRLLLTIAPAALLIVAQVAFRLSYYGRWLPNTFAVKVSGFYPIPGLIQTVLFARDNLLGMEAVAILLAIPPAISWMLGAPGRQQPNQDTAARRRGADSRNRDGTPYPWCTVPVAACLAAAGSYLLYVVAIGGDSYEYRFFHPILVLLALPATVGFARLFDLGGAALPRLAPATLALVAAKGLIVSTAGFQVVERTVELGGSKSVVSIASLEYSQRVCRVWSLAGRWIGLHADPSETIAIGAVGAVPYYSRLRTIDILGLIEAEGASFPPDDRRVVGHERRADPNWVMARRPDYYSVYPNTIRLPGADPLREVTITLPTGMKYHFQSVSGRAKIRPGEYSYDSAQVPSSQGDDR